MEHDPTRPRRIGGTEDVDIDLVFDEALRIARRLVEIDDAGVLWMFRIKSAAGHALQPLKGTRFAEGMAFGK